MLFSSSGYGAPPAGGGGGARGCTIAIENLPMSATTPRLRKSVFYVIMNWVHYRSLSDYPHFDFFIYFDFLSSDVSQLDYHISEQQNIVFMLFFKTLPKDDCLKTQVG